MDVAGQKAKEFVEKGNPVRIFLSHASEDQPDFVRPLAEALSVVPDEFKVWYSEYELTLGDRLLARIDAGLKNCDYGIVVLSPHFFAKRWPREELEGLFQLETTERKVILPIWKDVSESDVKAFSPILASRLGADAAVGIPRIVEEIRRAVGLIDRSKQLSTAAWMEKLKKLDEDVGHARRVIEFSATPEAVALVTKVAFEIIDDAWKAAARLVTELSAMRLHLPPRKSKHHYFAITGPKRLTLNLHFSTVYGNSIEGTRLRIGVFRARDNYDETSKNKIIETIDLHPSFDKEMKVFWTAPDLTFANGTAILDFAFDKFVAALSADQ